MKKLLSVIFSVVAILCLFTACKTVSDDDNGEATNTADFNVFVNESNKLSIVENIVIYKGEKVSVLALKNNPKNANDSHTIDTWEISDDTIASIQAYKSRPYQLNVEGKKEGTATITAKDANGATKTFNVTVKLADIQASTAQITLWKVGTEEVSKDLSSLFTVSDGLEPTYNVNNTSVVSIEGGKIIAKGKGTAIITAKYKQLASAKVSVTVYDKDINLPSDLFVLLYNDDVKESVDFNVISMYDTLNYNSNNKTVVDYENGKLVAKGIGEATVTVSNSDNTSTQSATVKVVNSKQVSVNTNSLTNANVNFFGRNQIKSNGVQFEYTVSGFEFKFYGTSAYAEMSAVASNGYLPRFQVLVDGEKVDQTETGSNKKDKTSADGQKILNVDNSSKTKYTLVEGLTEGWHTVKVLKRTPAKRGTTIMDKAILYNVSVNEGGYLWLAPDRSDVKIEVYGDSISCAYGNLVGGDTMDSNTTNGLLGYHYLAAEKLGAEINVQAHSGWGIISGTDKNISSSYLWVNNFNKYSDTTTSYDMSYDADIIVINLGTNDASSEHTIDNFGTKLTNATVTWVKKLLSYNPDAKVLLTYGMMGKNQTVINSFNSAVTKLKNDGYNNVYYYTYEGSYDNGGHPSKADHVSNANYLANKISEILGL